MSHGLARPSETGLAIREVLSLGGVRLNRLKAYTRASDILMKCNGVR